MKTWIFFFFLLPFTVALGQSNRVSDSLTTGAKKKTNSTYQAKKREDTFTPQPLEDQHTWAEATLDYLSLGHTYFCLGQKEKALDFAELALQKGKKSNDLKLIAQARTMLGRFLNGQNRFEEARPYLFEALKMFTEQEDKFGTITTMAHLSSVYAAQKQYPKAFALLDSANALVPFIKEKQKIMVIRTSQGMAYTSLGRHQKAIHFFNSALAIASELDATTHQMDVAGQLATNYEKINQFKKAAAFYKIQSELKDTIFQKLLKGTIAETKYTTQRILNEKLIEEQKNAELLKTNLIKDLKLLEEKTANNNLLLWGGLSFGMVLLIGMVGYFITKVKETKSKRKEETLRFRAVLEAEEKERARIAKDLHDGLGQLLSTAKLNISGLEDEIKGEDKVLVQNSMHLIDEAVQEIRSIAHNMMPAALMEYGLISAIESFARAINETKTLQVNFSSKAMQDRLEKSKEIALYRVVQEILHNILKYAQADEVNIALTRIKDTVLLTISDNGQGFDVKTIHQSNGIGWRNIYSRISMVNGAIEVNSTKGKGTDIRIKIMF